MKSPSWIDHLSFAIILINTLLMLAGILAFRYEQTRHGTERWSPAPPPAFVDPFETYRQPLT